MKSATLIATIIVPAVLALPMIDIGVIVPFTSPFGRRSSISTISNTSARPFPSESGSESRPGDDISQLGDLTWILEGMKDAMSRTMAGLTNAVNMKPQPFQVIPMG